MDTAAYAMFILSAISVHTNQTADKVNDAISAIDRTVADAAPYVNAYFPAKSEQELITAYTGRLASRKLYTAVEQPRTTGRPSV